MKRKRCCDDHSCGLCSSNNEMNAKLLLQFVKLMREINAKWMRGKRKGYKGNFECFLAILEDAVVVQRAKSMENCFFKTESQP